MPFRAQGSGLRFRVSGLGFRVPKPLSRNRVHPGVNAKWNLTHGLRPVSAGGFRV